MAKQKPGDEPARRRPGRPQKQKVFELTSVSVTMRTDLLKLIEDEMASTYVFNRTLLIRQLIVECLTARRKKRGETTPEGLDRAE